MNLGESDGIAPPEWPGAGGYVGLLFAKTGTIRRGQGLGEDGYSLELAE